MNPIEIIIRDYHSHNDDPYIYSTWTKYAWHSNKADIKMPKQTWFKDKIVKIKDILLRGTIKIACFKADPYVIAGYVVVHDGMIQWICIKKDLRNQGIESLLTHSIKDKVRE